MSLTNSIRLYSQTKDFNQLIGITAPLIRSIKEGRLITGSLLGFIDELYMELVQRKEIEPIGRISETDKKRFWLAAKKTGETDRQKLIQIARSVYLCEQI